MARPKKQAETLSNSDGAPLYWQHRLHLKELGTVFGVATTEQIAAFEKQLAENGVVVDMAKWLGPVEPPSKQRKTME
jgi:hypothetical protein